MLYFYYYYYYTRFSCEIGCLSVSLHEPSVCSEASYFHHLYPCLQELVKSDFFDRVPFSKILGRCYVMFVKDYFKLKPQVRLTLVWSCRALYYVPADAAQSLCTHMLSPAKGVHIKFSRRNNKNNRKYIK